MAAATTKKPRKLFLIEQLPSNHSSATSYYATGTDAHEVYARLVAHDEKEGNYSHTDMIDVSVQVTEIDFEALPEFLAWEMG